MLEDDTPIGTSVYDLEATDSDGTAPGNKVSIFFFWSGVVLFPSDRQKRSSLFLFVSARVPLGSVSGPFFFILFLKVLLILLSLLHFYICTYDATALINDADLTRIVIVGVPQRPVLGPILFIIFIKNDNLTIKFFTFLYTDYQQYKRYLSLYNTSYNHRSAAKVSFMANSIIIFIKNIFHLIMFSKFLCVNLDTVIDLKDTL